MMLGTVLKTLSLIVFNGIMIVLVVMYGKIFCKYSYAFSFSLPLYGTVFFYVCFVCKYRRLNVFAPVHLQMRPQVLKILHRQALLNGFVWSANYVCLLSANSFVPGLFQVVINESNLVVVFLMSMFLMGNRYHKSQWFCFVLVLVGGLMPLAGSQTGEITIKWFLLYLLGAWAIGFANLITENVMRNLYVTTGREAPNDKISLIPETQFLTLTNFYGIFCVLALFWVPQLAQGGEWLGYFTRGMACLWTGQCNADDSKMCASHGHENDKMIGLLSMWLSSTFSFLSAGIAANIQRDRDVVYVTVALTLAPVLSMCLFMVQVSRFYDVPTNLELCANIVTFAGGFGYKVCSHMRSTRSAKSSTLTKIFKFEPPSDGLTHQFEPDVSTNEEA